MQMGQGDGSLSQQGYQQKGQGGAESEARGRGKNVCLCSARIQEGSRCEKQDRDRRGNPLSCREDHRP